MGVNLVEYDDDGWWYQLVKKSFEEPGLLWMIRGQSKYKWQVGKW